MKFKGYHEFYDYQDPMSNVHTEYFESDDEEDIRTQMIRWSAKKNGIVICETSIKEKTDNGGWKTIEFNRSEY